MVFFYLSIALLFLYGLLFQFFNSWWNAIPLFEPGKKDVYQPVTSISVIVPARNEAVNIAACVRSVCTQNYPLHLLQVIVIDDDSDDDTFSIVSNIKYEGVQIICHRLASVSNNIAPKKRAIETGISLASGTLIVTTDADCIAGGQWLRNIAARYEQAGDVFIAAPVKITTDHSLLSKFQAIDFLTMQGITGAAVSKRFLHMCNGANLAYEKKVFYEVGGFDGIDNIASGDDMLLMNKITRQYPAQYGFIKSQQAIVNTLPAHSWKAFFQQRIRWASKATHYQQPKIFFVLLLVYLTNLLIFCFLLLGIFQPFALLLFLFLCMAKFFMEFFFVKDVSAFFNHEKLIPWLLFLQPLHIGYIVLSGFLGQFKTYQWKGRKLK